MAHSPVFLFLPEQRGSGSIYRCHITARGPGDWEGWCRMYYNWIIYTIWEGLWFSSVQCDRLKVDFQVYCRYLLGTDWREWCWARCLRNHGCLHLEWVQFSWTAENLKGTFCYHFMTPFTDFFIKSRSWFSQVSHYYINHLLLVHFNLCLHLQNLN